jgi:ABC-type antimicrobial peptide transport system permease subunit
VGKRLTLSFFPGRMREVVGVVGDVKLDGVDQLEPNSALYVPLTQVFAPSDRDWRSFGLEMVVRTNTAPDTVASAVSNAVHETDPDQAVLNLMTMEQFLADSLTPQRFNMLMLATFAGVALAMAAMGIYSVLSYMVRRRVREIGIRMALGAQIRDVLRLVVFEGMRPVIAGILIGVTAALLLGRVVSKMIYGVKPSDPVTYVAVSALLATVALMATAVPAYRATKVDPMKTLRDE